MKHPYLAYFLAGVLALTSGSYRREPKKILDPNEPTPKAKIEPQDPNSYENKSYNSFSEKRPKRKKPIPPKKTSYNFEDHFVIKDLGTVLEKIIFGKDHKGYLDKNKEKYSRGYILEVFRNGECIKTIKDLPDFFVITNFSTMSSKTIMGKDYQKYLDENKKEYTRGYRIKIYEGNDLAEVIESESQ